MLFCITFLWIIGITIQPSDFLKTGLYDQIFLSRSFKSVKIFQETKCASWNIIQFAHTIKFYLYGHDNVSFIERINNFHFSCHRYCSFENIEKVITITLLAIGVKSDGEDEQVKKGKKDLFGWSHGQKAQTKTRFFFTVIVQRFSKTFQWMRNVYQR